MFSICSVFVQYLFSQELNIYWPNSGQIVVIDLKLRSSKKIFFRIGASLQYFFVPLQRIFILMRIIMARPIRETPVLKDGDEHARLMYFDMMEIAE